LVGSKISSVNKTISVVSSCLVNSGLVGSGLGVWCREKTAEGEVEAEVAEEAEEEAEKTGRMMFLAGRLRSEEVAEEAEKQRRG